MTELKKEYLVLFTGISNTIRSLEENVEQLKKLQQEAEEAYLQESA